MTSINIEDLDKRIRIIKLKEVEGPLNKLEHEVVRECWAGLNNLYGKEFWEAASSQAENTLIFKTRYFKVKNIKGDFVDLDSSYKIQWKNRMFDIIHVDNVKYRNEEYKIKVKEVLKDGSRP